MIVTPTFIEIDKHGNELQRVQQSRKQKDIPGLEQTLAALIFKRIRRKIRVSVDDLQSYLKKNRKEGA